MRRGSREVVHASGHAVAERFELALEPQGQSIQACSSCGNHGFLALVVVAQVPRQLRPQLQRDPAGQVPGELVPPFPNVVGDDFPGQRVVGVVVRAFWGKLPGVQPLHAKVEGEGGVGEGLGPAHLNVVRQPPLRHDA